VYLGASMTSISEYDGLVKRLNRASLAALVVFLAMAFLPCALRAQVNGPPASVTSLGFGGHNGSIHGVAPSVTSMGPRGYTPGRTQPPQNNGLFGVNSGQNINGRHHPRNGAYYPGYYGYYGGYYDNGYDQANAPPQDDQYNGGPTIFDRRGSGAASYVPSPNDDRDRSEQASQVQSEPAPEPAPASDQPATVLVFKDGHQSEVSNYAIVGNTLYDLSDGRRHKIALDDLNLTATSKENEDRGTDFQLPAGTQAN